MTNIVDDRNVVTEKFCSNAVVEKGALFQDRQTAKVPEHEADKIEYGRWFQNDGVFSWRELVGVLRIERFLRRDFRQPTGIEGACVGRIGFLPARGIMVQHGDRDLSRRLAMKGAHAIRVDQRFSGLRTGIDSGGGQAVLLGDAYDLSHTLSTVRRSDRRSALEPARRIFTLSGLFRLYQRQPLRIRLLHAGNAFRGLYCPLETVGVKAVRSGPCSLAVKP